MLDLACRLLQGLRQQLGPGPIVLQQVERHA
jgi:hypothetical protein